MLSKHLQLSNLFSFFSFHLFQTSWNPVAVSLQGLYFWLWFLLTEPQPHYCLLLIASPWGASGGETQNLFDSLRQFHFTVPFSSFSHIPQFFTVDGKHHFVLLKETEEDLTWELVAPPASAWWLQWVSGFCIPPTPLALHTYTHPSCSLLTAASLNLSGGKFTMI